MDKQTPLLDERTVAVADRSYRLAYMVLAFGCFVDICVRAMIYKQALLDMLALIFVSGAVASIYQRSKRVQLVSRRFSLIVFLLGAIGGVAFAVVIALLKQFWHS